MLAKYKHLTWVLVGKPTSAKPANHATDSQRRSDGGMLSGNRCVVAKNGHILSGPDLQYVCGGNMLW